MEHHCRHDPKCGETEPYRQGYADGQRDRTVADRLGSGPVETSLRNHVPGAPPMWITPLGMGPQEAQEVVEAVG